MIFTRIANKARTMRGAYIMEKQYEVPDESILKKVLEKNSEEGARIAKDDNKLKQLIANTLKKLENLPVIGTLIEDARLFVSVVSDYRKGIYKGIPLASIIMIIVALTYLINPIDIIPDMIPVVGYLDDIAMLKFVQQAIHKDLEDYKRWKEENETEPVVTFIELDHDMDGGE